MPKNKAGDVLASGVLPHSAHWAMLTGLRTHALRILGDGDRDLDEVGLTMDASNPACAMFVGTWKGLPRLAATLTVQKDEAEIVLIVTKGTTAVDGSLFGKSGPGIGNSILVAAVLHIGLFYLRASGIRFMTNHPFDNRVRAIYTLMGFTNGEKLDLYDAIAIEKAFRYVESAYKQRSLSLTRAPLPF